MFSILQWTNILGIFHKILSHEGSNNMMGGLLREARVVFWTSTGLGFIPGVYKPNFNRFKYEICYNPIFLTH
jgi:hypothetical protein